MAALKQHKMDRYLISAKQKWEILFVRLIHFKLVGEKVEHPSSEEIISLIKTHHNSRKRVYLSLKEMGYQKIKR